jgi:hypothetical protein
VIYFKPLNNKSLAPAFKPGNKNFPNINFSLSSQINESATPCKHAGRGGPDTVWDGVGNFLANMQGRGGNFPANARPPWRMRGREKGPLPKGCLWQNYTNGHEFHGLIFIDFFLYMLK